MNVGVNAEFERLKADVNKYKKQRWVFSVVSFFLGIIFAACSVFYLVMFVEHPSIDEPTPFTVETAVQQMLERATETPSPFYLMMNL